MSDREMEFNGVNILTPDSVQEAYGNGNSVGEIIGGGNTLQQIRTNYITAVSVQKKRDIKEIVEKCCQEAEYAGDSLWYGWTQGGKRIEGETIDLAMIVGRNWTNSVVDIRLEDNGGYYLFTADFIDLENGVTLPRLFKQNKERKLSGKMQAGGGAELARQDDITFQIGQSKAIRNAILRATPTWLHKLMIDRARDAIAKNLVGTKLETARIETVALFEKKYGVTQEMLETYLENRPLASWVASDLMELKGVFNAIKEGREFADKIFVKKSDTAPQNSAETKAETKPESPAPATAPSSPELSKEQMQEIAFIQKGLEALAKFYGEKGTEFNGANQLRLITDNEKIGTVSELSKHPDLIGKVSTAISGMLDENKITIGTVK